MKSTEESVIVKNASNKLNNIIHIIKAKAIKNIGRNGHFSIIKGASSSLFIKSENTGKDKETLELFDIKKEIDLISIYRFTFIFHNLKIQIPVKYPSETYRY